MAHLAESARNVRHVIAAHGNVDPTPNDQLGSGQAEQRAAVRVELLLVRLGASDVEGPGNVAVWKIEETHELGDAERTALWEYFELGWERRSAEGGITGCVLDR